MIIPLILFKGPWQKFWWQPIHARTIPLYASFLFAASAFSNDTTLPWYSVAMELYKEASIVSSVLFAVCNASRLFGFSGTLRPLSNAALHESVQSAICRMRMASSLSPFGFRGFVLQ